ncbi:MAG: glutathione S-transferase family protein [Alphaproteobacteria bacterium]|nr:glutathione S-transferase family protein [Alphaproteobacteria bacterium]
MAELLLYHYALSPFAEIVRVALGIKRLAWRSVEAPMIMPKPDLLALTGGYRRIPVLQVGADVYCDTACILEELEARHREPALLPQGLRGLALALQHWAGLGLAWNVGRFIVGTAPEAFPMEFHADRAAMWAVPLDLNRLRRSAPRYRDRLREQLRWLADMLRERPFLLGAGPTLADAAIYGHCWFLRQAHARTAALLDPQPAVLAWMDRIAAIGHGDARPLASGDALAIAAAASPAGGQGVDGENGLGLRAGASIAVTPDDYGRDAVIGILAGLDDRRISLRREHPATGEVVVHFPRLGYAVRAA